MKNKDTSVNLNINLQYPYNDKYEYLTYLKRINLDEARENDIKSGRGFIISQPKTIKKDLKEQDGIFSSRYGNTMQDADSFIDRYRCDCGMMRGAINHGMRCDVCGTMVKFVDDNMSIFGWLVLKDPYYVIHPNLYRSLESFIGSTKLNNIICPEINVDSDGKQIERTYKKDEIFKGIGLMQFKERINEILDYYLAKHPNKKNYYDDIKAHQSLLFTHSIPVFTTLLRPTKLDNASLKYEKTNENYEMLGKLVYSCNNDKLRIYRKPKDKLNILYDIQTQLNEVYNELKEILSKKKGDIRSSLGGRFCFTERSVITQGTDLMPDQIRLPYHGLCELLQQVIINILVRTYNFSYADAYKKWYKGQLGFDQIIYNIIEALIKDSGKGLPVIINRNPTINYGGILFMRCIGINKDYTMSIPLQILKLLAADFDGDTLNIMYLYSKDFINMAEKILSPRVMFISRNDGMFNNDVNFARDTIINANALKSLYKYNDEQIKHIKRLQGLQ